MKTLFATALALACACMPVLAAPGDYETIYLHDIKGGKALFTKLIKQDAATSKAIPLYYARDTATCKILVHELPGNNFEGNLRCESPNAAKLYYNLQGTFRPLKISIGRTCKSPTLIRSRKRSHTIRVICEDREITGTFTIPR